MRTCSLGACNRCACIVGACSMATCSVIRGGHGPAKGRPCMWLPREAGPGEEQRQAPLWVRLQSQQVVGFRLGILDRWSQCSDARWGVRCFGRIGGCQGGGWALVRVPVSVSKQFCELGTWHQPRQLGPCSAGIHIVPCTLDWPGKMVRCMGRQASAGEGVGYRFYHRCEYRCQDHLNMASSCFWGGCGQARRGRWCCEHRVPVGAV